MAKLIALTALVFSLGCGSGPGEVPAPRPGSSPAAILTGSCTGDPSDCGVKVCVDCTGGGPPNTEAACVRGECAYFCAAGFRDCGTCVPDTDINTCGPGCTPCTAPPHGSPICGSLGCDFACEFGYAKSGTRCIPQSFSISY
jgi:hypothetical protein